MLGVATEVPMESWHSSFRLSLGKKKSARKETVAVITCYLRLGIVCVCVCFFHSSPLFQKVKDLSYDSSNRTIGKNVEICFFSFSLACSIGLCLTL